MCRAAALVSQGRRNGGCMGEGAREVNCTLRENGRVFAPLPYHLSQDPTEYYKCYYGLSVVDLDLYDDLGGHVSVGSSKRNQVPRPKRNAGSVSII